MKAAVLKELDGPPVFDDFEDPVAGEGQAVVEIVAAAIHHVDLARASGTFYLGPPPLPSVLGVDGVGRLVDGRRVFIDAAVAPFGTWAQRTLVRTDSLLCALKSRFTRLAARVYLEPMTIPLWSKYEPER